MRGEYAKTLRSMGIRGFFARNGSTYLNARFRRPNIQTSEYGRPYRRIPHGVASHRHSRSRAHWHRAALPEKFSLTAVTIASVIGFALGGALAVYRFPGRGAISAVKARPTPPMLHPIPGGPISRVPPGATPSMGGSHCSRAIPAANRGLTPYSLCRQKRTSGFM